MPYVLTKGVLALLGAAFPGGFIPHESFVLLAVLPTIVATTVAYLWRSQFIIFFGHIQHFAAGVFQFTSFFGLLVLGNLLWCGWQARNLNAPRQLHQTASFGIAAAGMHPHSRVIWLLFDELSFEQTYGQRFPGLELPAFDRLADTSTVFTHVVPAGIQTEKVIPSLFTGVPSNDIRISTDGQLRALHNTASDSWQPFDAHQTVFQDALDRGYRTAISGWYNPYCRILAPVLDSCLWAYYQMDPRWIAVAPFVQKRLDHKLAVGHVDNYRHLSVAADDVLANPYMDFAFLHLPIPHPEAIYDRHHHILTTDGGSYLDNLALADQYLAHVRQILEESGQWDSSTLIVMGDHSWRTALIWRHDNSWTAEDELASHGGQFDDRPGYIIKLPNQQTSAHIDTRFAAKDTRALLDALMDGRLHTPDDLKAWIEEQNP